MAAGGIALIAASFGVMSVSADNSNTQTAANSAISSQVATAISGDSFATNGSFALSGAAVSSSSLNTVQSILQRARNMTAVLESNNANTQDAANAMDKAQQATAASGIATADEASESLTGEVAALLDEIEQQIVDQHAENSVDAAEPADEEPPVDEEGGEAP
jgi:hypothetical protein